MGKKVELVTCYSNIGKWWGLQIMGIGTSVPIIWKRLKKTSDYYPFTKVVKSQEPLLLWQMF